MSIDVKGTDLQPALTGNRGEWSELYTLVYLLSTGRLESANDNLEYRGSIFSYPENSS